MRSWLAICKRWRIGNWQAGDEFSLDDALCDLPFWYFGYLANVSLCKLNRNHPTGKRAKVYIKINEKEIAVDYPLPAYYKAEEEETEEYIVIDDDNAILAPNELPQRGLYDWTLYNSDSRLVSLELHSHAFWSAS